MQEQQRLERLSGTVPVELPYARHAVPQGSSNHVDLPCPLPDSVRAVLRGLGDGPREVLLIAINGAFLARVTGQHALHIGFSEPGLWRNSDPAPARVAPFSFQLSADTRLSDLREQTERQLEWLRSFGKSREEAARTLSDALKNATYPFSIAREELSTRNTSSDLVLAITTDGTCHLRYDAARYAHETVALLARQFASYAAQLVERPDTPIVQIPLLDAAERARVLEHWNDTNLPFPEQLSVARAFAEQVARTPDAPALAFRNEELSYRSLDERAARLAARLQTAGVGPEVRVGIYCERATELVVAVLAVLKAGGAYVPLDPALPRDRVQFMVEDTGMRVVLAQAHLHAELDGVAALLVDVRDDPTAPAECENDVQPEHLAYVLFTSGSTGRPKAVMVEHRNVINLFAAMDKHLQPARTGVWLAVTSLSFDISVVELLWSLCRGFKVVLYREAARDGASSADESFAALLRRHEVTHLQCTPTMANMFLADPNARNELHRLEELILAGEAYPIALARQLRTYTRCTLRNIYGPTETTVYSVGYVVDPESDSVPIGRPLGNTQLYVLDPQGEPVLVGVPGELFIGGHGVSRGYLNRPDLTNQRFVPDHFSGRANARLYRTGDLVRFRSDGNLDFLGRIDHQVKIRGYRMELGEIENVLAQHTHVREAVVTVREDIPGNKRLVAYIVQASWSALTEAALRNALKQHLKEKLPPYMVPASFAFLPAFPQTTSGKVDRKVLPAPETLRQRKPVSHGEHVRSESGASV